MGTGEDEGEAEGEAEGDTSLVVVVVVAGDDGDGDPGTGDGGASGGSGDGGGEGRGEGGGDGYWPLNATHSSVVAQSAGVGVASQRRTSLSMQQRRSWQPDHIELGHVCTASSSATAVEFVDISV